MADALTTETPTARAQARFVRVSASKARRVIDVIRGMPAEEALAVLRFSPQAASEPVYKVLASAVANARFDADKHGRRFDADRLLISEAFVDEGPTLKRFRPRAQGRAYRIRKRTSHITVVVRETEPAATRPAGKQTSKGRTR